MYEARVYKCITFTSSPTGHDFSFEHAIFVHFVDFVVFVGRVPIALDIGTEECANYSDECSVVQRPVHCRRSAHHENSRHRYQVFPVREHCFCDFPFYFLKAKINKLLSRNLAHFLLRWLSDAADFFHVQGQLEARNRIRARRVNVYCEFHES